MKLIISILSLLLLTDTALSSEFSVSDYVKTIEKEVESGRYKSRRAFQKNVENYNELTKNIKDDLIFFSKSNYNYLKQNNYRQRRENLSLLLAVQEMNIQNQNSVSNIVKLVKRFENSILLNEKMKIEAKRYLSENNQKILEVFNDLKLYEVGLIAKLAKISSLNSKIVKNNSKKIKIKTQKKKSESTGFFKYLSATLAIMTLFLVGYFKREARRVFKKAELAAKKTVRKNIQKNTAKNYNRITDVAIAVVNKKGLVSFTNNAFVEFFGKKPGTFNWDEFILQNFKKESSLKSVKGLYKCINDIRNDYFIKKSINKKTGDSICWMYRFKAETLTSIGNARNNVLEGAKINVLDIIDEVISKKSNMYTRQFIDFADFENADDVYMYASESEVTNIFQKIISALSLLQSKSTKNSLGTIKCKRVNNKFTFCAEIKGLKVDTKLLTEVVTWEGHSKSIGQFLKDAEDSCLNLELTTLIKNRETQAENITSLEMTFSDLDSVKWVEREYRI